MELGGGLAFSSQVTDYESSSTNHDYSIFSLQPYIGIMISQDFELGFLPGITAAWNGSSSTIINLFFAPSVNIDTKTNVYPFIEALIGYNSTGPATARSGLGIGVDGGLKVNITGNSLLLVQLQYLQQHFEDKNSPPNSYYNYSLDLRTFSFSVGYRVFIPRNVSTTK